MCFPSRRASGERELVSWLRNCPGLLQRSGKQIDADEHAAPNYGLDKFIPGVDFPKFTPGLEFLDFSLGMNSMFIDL